MGREVRRVPADWQHPKEFNVYRGKEEYKPLFDRDWREAAADWDRDREAWERGDRPDYAAEYAPDYPFDQWEGRRPYSGDYMPNWPASERTHLMMYEDTSEGTPISPAFTAPEELARWLADNGASSFGNSTATYEQWLPICRGGWAPSMVMQDSTLMSGVEFMSRDTDGSPKGGDAEGGSVRSTTAGAEGIAKDQSNV